MKYFKIHNDFVYDALNGSSGVQDETQFNARGCKQSIIREALIGKHYSLLFLKATPLSQSRTLRLLR